MSTAQRVHLWRVHLWTVIALAAVAVLTIRPAEAQVPDWPDFYDPGAMLAFTVELAGSDWETIKADDTFDIEVPACLSADGESPILVSIRRKSADPLGYDPADPDNYNGVKVSYKIDINEYEDMTADAFPGVASLCPGAPGLDTWKKLKKLSLENGDDINVITEGLGWYLHRAAVESGITPNYEPGYAAWVTLTINGESQGVYVNVEQRDKQFLRNRGLWEVDGDGTTWLYKEQELKEGDGESPTTAALCYSPFVDEGGGGGGGGKGKGKPPKEPTTSAPCSEPADFVADVSARVNMDVMLTVGAVNAFSANPDELFNKDHNFFYVDFLNDKRLYIPWDLDTAIKDADASIYYLRRRGNKIVQGTYQEKLLAPDTFRDDYNAKMLQLLNAPEFDPAALQAFLTSTESLIGGAVAADPNNNLDAEPGVVPAEFNRLRQWVADRHVNVQQQLDDDTSAPAAGKRIAGDTGLPSGYMLTEAYPNPFNPTTTLEFSVPDDQQLRITMHNMLGQTVRELYNDQASAGALQTVRIDASGLPSGLYLIRFAGAGVQAHRTVVLQK